MGYDDENKETDRYREDARRIIELATNDPHFPRCGRFEVKDGDVFSVDLEQQTVQQNILYRRPFNLSRHQAKRAIEHLVKTNQMLRFRFYKSNGILVHVSDETYDNFGDEDPIAKAESKQTEKSKKQSQYSGLIVRLALPRLTERELVATSIAQSGGSILGTDSVLNKISWSPTAIPKPDGNFRITLPVGATLYTLEVQSSAFEEVGADGLTFFFHQQPSMALTSAGHFVPDLSFLAAFGSSAVTVGLPTPEFGLPDWFGQIGGLQTPLMGAIAITLTPEHEVFITQFPQQNRGEEYLDQPQAFPLDLVSGRQNSLDQYLDARQWYSRGFLSFDEDNFGSLTKGLRDQIEALVLTAECWTELADFASSVIRVEESEVISPEILRDARKVSDGTLEEVRHALAERTWQVIQPSLLSFNGTYLLIH